MLVSPLTSSFMIYLVMGYLMLTFDLLVFTFDYSLNYLYFQCSIVNIFYLSIICLHIVSSIPNINTHNTNNLYTIILFNVEINLFSSNHMVSSNYSYLIICICLHTVKSFKYSYLLFGIILVFRVSLLSWLFRLLLL